MKNRGSYSGSGKLVLVHNWTEKLDVVKHPFFPFFVFGHTCRIGGYPRVGVQNMAYDNFENIRPDKGKSLNSFFCCFFVWPFGRTIFNVLPTGPCSSTPGLL